MLVTFAFSNNVIHLDLFFLFFISYHSFFLLQLITKESEFAGSDKSSSRKRAALLHSLVQLAPKGDGKTSVTGCIRDCLYNIAPVALWQYFSSQGRTKSTQYSLLHDLPNIYQIVLTASAQIYHLPQKELIQAVSNVIKSCKSRSSAKEYRRKHPELGLVDVSHTNDDCFFDNFEELGDSD